MDKRLAKVSSEQRLMEWAELVRECRSSELTCREWCAQHGIAERRYHYWQKRVFERAIVEKGESAAKGLPEERTVRFVELPEPQERNYYAQRAGQAIASIRIGEAAIEIYPWTEPDVVKQLYQVLRTC